MTCTDYKRWLSAYVDEQLEPAQRTQLETHLHTCTTCQTELTSLQQMLQSLRTMEAPQTPNLLPGIHKQLTSQSFVQRFLAPWPASLPLHGLALAATAAVALIMVGLPRTFHRSSLESPMQVALDKGASSSDVESASQSSVNGRLLRQEREAEEFRDQFGGRARQAKVSAPAAIQDERATGTESLKNSATPTAPSQKERQQDDGSYQSDEAIRSAVLSQMAQQAEDQSKYGVNVFAIARRGASEKSADAATTFPQNLSDTKQYEAYYARRDANGSTSLEIPSSNEKTNAVLAGSAGAGVAAIASGGASVTGEAKQTAEPENLKSIAPEKKKVELPQSVPTLLQVRWKVKNLDEARARVIQWVGKDGFAIATNDHHLSVKLPPMLVQAFLEQFSSARIVYQPLPSEPALWVTISLELVLSSE